MPGRQYSSTTGYRYGFNGKEKDNKDGIVQYDYGFRIYDPRLVRFKSVDPITKKYPELTPYQFASNRPIDGIDEEGLEYLSNLRSRQNTYFANLNDAVLKPRESVRSYDPSKKSMTQSWRDSKNFFANMTYHMANGVYTFPQQVTRGVTGQSQIYNIGGDSYPSGGIGGEKQRAANFVDFSSTLLPSGVVESKTVNLFNKFSDNILLSIEQQVTEQAASRTMASVKDKLSRYLLNVDHSIGKDKAKWFEKALGFTQKNSDDLAKQIVFDINKAVQTEVTKYGIKYNQTIGITGANNKTIDVLFSWIKSNSDGLVRLVTAIPTKK